MTYHRSEVGPLAIVISSRPIGAADAEWIARLVNAYNVLVSDGGPVLHSVAPSAMQRAAAEVAALERLTGARLTHEVILTSKRNSQRAHRKLAEVALKIARRLNGVVDLTDLIDELTVAHTVTGRTSDGKPFEYHVATPETLESWMAHPRFRMAC